MKDTSEDLSVRARRGELDDSLSKQLSLLLDGSLEARLAHRAGCEFDAQDSVLPGDHALAERITERLLLARPVAPRPRAALKPWQKAALGATALAGLVAALLFALRGSRVESAPAGASDSARYAGTSGNTPGAGAAVPGAASPASPAELPSAPGVDSTPPSASGILPAEPRVAPSPGAPASKRAAPVANSAQSRASRSPAALGDESASALFARANRARRETDAQGAVTLYERLQRRFPRAAEALASEIPLGLLKLQLGDANQALAHFTAYLTRAPTGELGPEALWGQAQALFALGKADSARQSLRLLLSQHPESAYAGAARAKLQAGH